MGHPHKSHFKDQTFVNGRAHLPHECLVFTELCQNEEYKLNNIVFIGLISLSCLFLDFFISRIIVTVYFLSCAAGSRSLSGSTSAKMFLF